MTDKQIIIDEQMENLNNLATQQLKRIEEEKRQIEHIAKTHLVETFDMQREIDKLKEDLQAKEQECERLRFPMQDTNYAILAKEEFEQLDQLKAENKELKKANIHIDNNRMVKADKLKRIEDLIIACSSGYTDEFIQELLVILHEPEPIKE